jgi:hypothetical protein
MPIPPCAAAVPIACATDARARRATDARALRAADSRARHRRLMSTHASILVNSVWPPSAEVCRTLASFP